MKNKYFQTIRGICIIAVIIIHSLIEKNDYGINIFNISIRQMINFPVAIFIFLSAYFTNISKMENSVKNYYKLRLKRLVIPFLIYTTIYAIIQNIFNYTGDSVIKIIIKTVLGLYSAQLYFIIVLVQLVLLTPIIIKLINKNNKLINIILWSITPIYIGIIYISNIIFKMQIPLYSTLFCGWFIFYYLGILIKNYNFNIKKISILVIPFLCIAIIEAMLLYKNNISYTFCISQIRFTCMLYSISLIAFIIKYKDYFTSKIRSNIISSVGDISFGIYFIHSIILLIFKQLLHNYINNYYVYEVMIILCTLIICYLGIRIFKKITKNKLDKILAL